MPQIVLEEFLEDINNMLNSGEVPNLFEKDELEQVLAATRPKAKEAGINEGNRDEVPTPLQRGMGGQGEGSTRFAVGVCVFSCVCLCALFRWMETHRCLLLLLGVGQNIGTEVDFRPSSCGTRIDINIIIIIIKEKMNCE